MVCIRLLLQCFYSRQAQGTSELWSGINARCTFERLAKSRPGHPYYKIEDIPLAAGFYEKITQKEAKPVFLL